MVASEGSLLEEFPETVIPASTVEEAEVRSPGKIRSSKNLQEAINCIPQSTQEILKEHFRGEFKGIIKL